MAVNRSIARLSSFAEAAQETPETDACAQAEVGKQHYRRDV
jgi:hypothetical protein